MSVIVRDAFLTKQQQQGKKNKDDESTANSWIQKSSTMSVAF